jgi:hypothetical protein
MYIESVIWVVTPFIFFGFSPPTYPPRCTQKRMIWAEMSFIIYYQTGHPVRKIKISLPKRLSGKENQDAFAKPTV